MSTCLNLCSRKLLVRYRSHADSILLVGDCDSSPRGIEEARELGRLTHPARRSQWLAGRTLARELLADAGIASDSSELQILSQDLAGRANRPHLLLNGSELDYSLSISHTSQGVLAALCTSPDQSVGVDLVGKIPLTTTFQTLWFTQREQRWLETDPARRLPMLWGLKEAFYKACQTGEPWSPRQIEIAPRMSNARGPKFSCLYFGRTIQPLRIDIQTFGTELGVVVITQKPSNTRENRESLI